MGQRSRYKHKVDELTAANVGLDYAHYEVHEGDAFSCCYYASTASGGVISMNIESPTTTKRAHLLLSVESNLPGVMVLYENPTWSAAGTGTALTSFNCNRNSTNTALTKLYSAPTLSGTLTGTTIMTRVVGAGNSNQTRVGGSVRSGFEYILKGSDKYYVKFTADTNATLVSINVEWYEH
jgi:hypothetical protein